MFNEDILIDRNRLDEECSTAPGYFDYWQTLEIKLKVDLENHEAQMSKDIRSCSETQLKEKYGIPKLTEGAISSIIKVDREYLSLKRQHLQAEAMRKSYEKKISLIDVLARLHGQGYFAKDSHKETRTFLAEAVKKEIAKQIRARKEGKPERPKK